MLLLACIHPPSSPDINAPLLQLGHQLPPSTFHTPIHLNLQLDKFQNDQLHLLRLLALEPIHLPQHPLGTLGILLLRHIGRRLVPLQRHFRGVRLRLAPGSHPQSIQIDLPRLYLVQQRRVRYAFFLPPIQRQLHGEDDFDVILERLLEPPKLRLGLLRRHGTEAIGRAPHELQFGPELLSLALPQLVEGESEFEEAVRDLLALAHEAGCLGGNAFHLDGQRLDVAFDFVEEVVVGGRDEIPREGRLGLAEPLFDPRLIFGGEVEGSRSPQTARHHALAADPSVIGTAIAILHLARVLGMLESHVVRPQEREQTFRRPQFRMQHDPPQELLQGATSILHEFGRESRHGLLIREGGDDRPSLLLVKAFVEP
mmetsp:Transcript_18754/g.39311  ORF Transcript_18754/g.39311 Transcript_18754/m.39311 type:complete len:370 (-) Transcript_18754:698-1807(-)